MQIARIHYLDPHAIWIWYEDTIRLISFICYNCFDLVVHVSGGFQG